MQRVTAGRITEWSSKDLYATNHEVPTLTAFFRWAASTSSGGWWWSEWCRRLRKSAIQLPARIKEPLLVISEPLTLHGVRLRTSDIKDDVQVVKLRSRDRALTGAEMGRSTGWNWWNFSTPAAILSNLLIQVYRRHLVHLPHSVLNCRAAVPILQLCRSAVASVLLSCLNLATHKLGQLIRQFSGHPAPTSSQGTILARDHVNPLAFTQEGGFHLCGFGVDLEDRGSVVTGSLHPYASFRHLDAGCSPRISSGKWGSSHTKCRALWAHMKIRPPGAR